MSQFLAEHRGAWGVSTVGIEELLEILLEQKVVIRAEFTSNKYDTIIRYSREKHSSNELALSLQRDSFLSHGTALATHGMAPPESIIYVNREQSPKPKGSGLSQESLQLGEDLLDGVQVWAVGRQEDQVRAGFSDGLADGLSPVAAEVVHDHHIAGMERGDEHLLDVGPEPRAIDRAVEDEGASMRSQRRAARKVRVFQ